ncbi:putative leucine-rich repeat-containing protein DDB_G0290503 isoform X2 [Pseudomyrmex gracilis]|uniref:putative leucine-rich repeat-containing protein DDB_G0290503 isoform X2 n=1 Tax=Pseudomyrmex gracilis TaxID=219809 RepID=UPI000995707C|nr:putative leucine-rich repeat-containing protein DDB_G0290503 isoform X2 [Pseudomyrmex gracilis]
MIDRRFRKLEIVDCLESTTLQSSRCRTNKTTSSSIHHREEKKRDGTTMSEAVAENPAEKVEDRPPTSGSQKSAIGSKIYKSRIPTSQTTGRSTARSDSTSRPPCEECCSEISSSNSARRLTMKTINLPTSIRKPTNPVSANEKRQLEVQFNSKKTRYVSLKKDLVHKQKVMQEMHEEISKLREKIIAIGGKDPGNVETLKPLQAECPKQQRLPIVPLETSPSNDKQQQQQQQQPICMDESAVIGVTLMQNQLQSLCDRSQEICQSVLDKSLSFAALVKTWLTESSQEEKYIDDNMLMYCVLEHPKLETQLAILGRDNEETRIRLDELRAIQSDFVTEFAKRTSSLRNEYDNCRGRVKQDQVPSVVEFMNLREQLNAALEDLKTERDKGNQTKDWMRGAERQLQKKIRDMEIYVTNMEASQQQLQNNVRSLQAQLKQKDHMMETKMKDMHKALKSSESLVMKVEKQRDNFEARIVELKEKMTSKEAEANATIKELSEKYEAISAEISEEKEKRQQAEDNLTEMEERCKHLEEKSQLLCDLASEKSNNLAVADNAHTENELGLYKDLEATRAELEKHKEKIKQLEHEKQEIVAVMHQVANYDNEDETKNKLAAELVAKTNDLQNLMLEHARLQKIAKFTQERNEMLENQLSEIQRRFHARSKENGSKSEIDAIELQQQICDLRNNLAEVMQQNQELEITLTQKQLELEQRDRVMREQSKFLKARDELLNLLKGKQQASADANSANENYEDINEINKQIAAKTEAIQELYATLESKQMQVMRLEKLVKLLEDQQDRAQAQRTRLEHRIAQLEVSLREKNGNSSNGSRAFDILKKKTL